MPPVTGAYKLRTKVGRVTRRLAPATWQSSSPNPILAEALGNWARANTDIHDHLSTLFYETVLAHPRLIVELGTRGGVSTRALLAAAEVADAAVLSVDIENCGDIDMPERFRRRWIFVQADDVAFAGEAFARFCAARELPVAADVILLDTSHIYEHTCKELNVWMPRLAAGGVMLFHDTNMGKGWSRRLNGKAEPGGNGTRGVIQAIEEFLGRNYDENTFFTDVVGGFLVHHVPWSSGLMILRKTDLEGTTRSRRLDHP